MKLTSIKWWCCVAWFNYQYFVCCNGNTCQPCQPNSDQLPSALPLTSSKYHHSEHSVNRTDNDIWIGFLAGYGNAKVGEFIFTKKQDMAIYLWCLNELRIHCVSLYSYSHIPGDKPTN